MSITLLYLNLLRLGMAAWPQTAVALAAPAAPAQTPTTITRTYSANSRPESGAAAASTTNQTTCTSSDYTLPTPVNVSSTAPGLTTIIDTPTRYTVHADDVASVRKQIADCPYRQRAGDYQAYTSYRLTWQYQMQTVAPGICRLSDVKVGLHINQFLPALVSSNTSLQMQWATYAEALRYHEAGHITIDTRHAQQLADNLAALGTMRCADLDAQAKLAINTQLTLLDTANELFDSHTNHGATQGAEL